MKELDRHLENAILTPYLVKANGLLAYAKDFNPDIKADLKQKLLSKGIEQKKLAKQACEIRAINEQDKLIIRASLEFSNVCRQRCTFCGMSANNKTLKRYRLTETEISNIINNVSSIGIENLHLASGEDWGFKVGLLSKIAALGAEKNMDITLVTSHRKISDYKILKNAGATRYILKVETTNPKIFQDARTGTHLPTRIAHLLYLRDIGFKIGSGIICGLPNQTVDDMVNDLLFLKELNPDMASVSRFLPNVHSGYSKENEGDPDITLNFLSLLRIELPNKQLRIPAGTTLDHRQIDAINHGANIISFHVTPEEYAELYSADQIKERNLIQLAEINNLSISSGVPLSTLIN